MSQVVLQKLRSPFWRLVELAGKEHARRCCRFMRGQGASDDEAALKTAEWYEAWCRQNPAGTFDTFISTRRFTKRALQ